MLYNIKIYSHLCVIQPKFCLQVHKKRLVQCDLCGSVKRVDNLKKHMNSHKCRKFCDSCGASVRSSEYEAHRASHLMNLHFQETTTSTINSPSDIVEKDELDVELKSIYEDFKKDIDDYTKIGKIRSIYNFKLKNFSCAEMCHHFKNVFREQNKKCAHCFLALNFQHLSTYQRSC